MDHRYTGRQDAEMMRERFNKDRMTITITLEDDDGVEIPYELPAKFGVCSTCDGEGKHVNPDIDSQGISPQEFAEDPDFEEAYFGGFYDVVCFECQGNRVTPQVEWDAIEKGNNEEHKISLKAWDNFIKSEMDYRAESKAERRFGR